MGGGEAVEQQPDGDEVREGVGRDRVGDGVGPLFHLADHAAPPAEGEEHPPEVAVPLAGRHPEQLQRLAGTVERTDVRVLQPGGFAGQSAKPGVRRPARPAVQPEERLV